TAARVYTCRLAAPHDAAFTAPGKVAELLPALATDRRRRPPTEPCWDSGAKRNHLTMIVCPATISTCSERSPVSGDLFASVASTRVSEPLGRIKRCDETRSRRDSEGRARARVDGPGRRLELEPWVDRFALESEDTEDAFVHTPERFLLDETLESFDAQR